MIGSSRRRQDSETPFGDHPSLRAIVEAAYRL